MSFAELDVALTHMLNIEMICFNEKNNFIIKQEGLKRDHFYCIRVRKIIFNPLKS